MQLTYPHREGWTFEQVNERVTLTLQNKTVKHLTTAFRRTNAKAPLAEARWDASLGEEEGTTAWLRVWRSLLHPASSNCDAKRRMRVLHRCVKLRIWQDNEAKCRMCGAGRDTFSHWPDCSMLGESAYNCYKGIQRIESEKEKESIAYNMTYIREEGRGEDPRWVEEGPNS